MSQKDEAEPAPSRLADVLYTLGLITANECQFHRILNSQEMEEFEEWLKTRQVEKRALR